MPLPVAHLPPELIGKVIQLAYPLTQGPTTSSHHKERTSFLRACSLVSRNWTPFAQAALWEDVQLGQQRDAYVLRDGRVGRYPVRRLTFNGHLQLERPIMLEVLRAVWGVKDLRIRGAIVSGMDWLGGEGYADLTSLSLSLTQFHALDLQPFKFKLESLTLVYNWGCVTPRPLVQSLLQSSLTSLHIRADSVSLLFFQDLNSVAAGLENLVLDIEHPNEEGLDDFLRRCTSLKSYTSSIDIPSLISIPSPLVQMTILYRPSPDGIVSQLLELLQTTSIALSSLELLMVKLPRSIMEERGFPGVGWIVVREECGKRKVEMRFDVLEDC